MKAFLTRFGVRSVEQAGSLEAPASGQRSLVPKSDGWYDVDSSGTETALGGGSSSSTFAPFCGDGNDGNVTISSTVTLTRDMYYDTLTVQSGGTLKTAGFRVFCKSPSTVDSGGSIHFNGNNGSSSSQGTAVNGSTASPLGGSNAGGAGSFSTPGSGTSTSQTTALGGAGGNGGGTFGAGSSAGTVTAPAVGLGGTTPRALPTLALGVIAATQIQAGSGGGGGGASGSGGGIGGGGGASGGVLLINAKSLTNNGTISANGGNGGNGTLASSLGAGGGGGGGGGVVIINCESFTGNTPTATGGTGGSAVGTASTAGSNGSAGTVLVKQWT